MADTGPKLPAQPSENDINDFLSKVDDLDAVLKGLNSKDVGEQVEYTKKADELIEKFDKEKAVKAKEEDDDDQDLPKTKFGFSRTCINKDAYKDDSPVDKGPQLPAGQGDVDQKAFMAAMEADANERYERKKKAEKVAAGLKEKGNEAFRREDYEEALSFYDKAIHEVRDSSVLYTNRAQAKIKLGMYKEALSDCDWALRAWPNSLKAYVHQGHAYMNLQQWEEARESYKAILNLDPKKEAVVKEYLSEVARREQASMDEQKAASLFEEGGEVAQGLVDLLTRVNKADQLPPYYAGGFRVITNILADKDSQTLFRTHGGLKFPETHAPLKRYLTANPAGLSREERDVLAAAFDMFTAACIDNETSQQQLFELPDFSLRLQNLLEMKVKGQGRQLKTSSLNLLYKFSLTEAGRSCIVKHFDLGRLITVLFSLITKKSATYGNTAGALLNNISIEKKSKSLLRNNIEESILPAFEDLLRKQQVSSDILATACSTATNLAGDIIIRNKFASRASLWKAVNDLLNLFNGLSKTDPLISCLGLLVNMSTQVQPEHLKSLDTTVALTLDAVLAQSIPFLPQQTLPASHSLLQSQTTDSQNADGGVTNKQTAQDENEQSRTSSKDGNEPNKKESTDQEQETNNLIPVQEVSSRTLAVLSNILPVNVQSVQCLVENEGLKRILNCVKMKDALLYKPAVKCLTALTQNSHEARCYIVENKGLTALLTHLSNSDEAIVGNSALCLSHLVKDSASFGGDSKQTLGAHVCSKLTKTSIVQKLLTLCRDGRKSDLQGNCAILLGGLAQGDSRHLEQLRELHGIQILHECMKHVKY